MLLVKNNLLIHKGKLNLDKINFKKINIFCNYFIIFSYFVIILLFLEQKNMQNVK